MGDYRELFDNLSRAYECRAIRGLVDAGKSLEKETERRFHEALVLAVNEVNRSGPSRRIVGGLPEELYVRVMTHCMGLETQS